MGPGRRGGVAVASLSHPAAPSLPPRHRAAGRLLRGVLVSANRISVSGRRPRPAPAGLLPALARVPVPGRAGQGKGGPWGLRDGRYGVDPRCDTSPPGGHHPLPLPRHRKQRARRDAVAAQPAQHVQCECPRPGRPPAAQLREGLPTLPSSLPGSGRGGMRRRRARVARLRRLGVAEPGGCSACWPGLARTICATFGAARIKGGEWSSAAAHGFCFRCAR